MKKPKNSDPITRAMNALRVTIAHEVTMGRSDITSWALVIKHNIKPMPAVEVYGAGCACSECANMIASAARKHAAEIEKSEKSGGSADQQYMVH